MTCPLYSMDGKVLALAGGVGGAKLALGLARTLPPDQLTIVVNTGDDECFHGLHVSPDLDTVMYTLAGLSNPETGWGLAQETFHALEMLQRYRAETWFGLGDMDLATHIRRTQLLREGMSLSEVTAELASCLGIAEQVVPLIVPMSDQPVRTVLETDAGDLPMQQYFVKHGSQPRVRSIRYEGAEHALPSPSFASALKQAAMVVFCPSNPFLSLGPILAIRGVRESLAAAPNKVAVSPIIGGAALRGPAAKIMAELGYPASCVGVARQYQGICDYFLLDQRDAGLTPEIEGLGMTALVAPIIMQSDDDKVALAKYVLSLPELS